MDASAWRQTLRIDGGLELQSPGDPSEIASVEHRLGIEFPTELRELYQVTNGIYHKPGEWFAMWLHLVTH